MSFWTQLAVMSAVMVTILSFFVVVYWIIIRRDQPGMERSQKKGGRAAGA